MKRTLLLLFAVLAALFTAAAFGASDPAADLRFPTLTGRVVDEAGLLSDAARQQLTDKLAQHERETSNQVVVATIKSLQGHTIEEYGYQMGRAWGIGQKDRNNGVVLIVAPNERKVRIEVGYGLEGVLTDAASNVIIHSIILPQFKEGRFEEGILAGTDALLGTLAGTYTPEPPQDSGVEGDTLQSALAAGFVFFFIGMLLGWRLNSPLKAGLISGPLSGGAVWLMFGSVMLAGFIGLGVALLNFAFGSIRSGGGGGGPGVSPGWGSDFGGFSGSSSSDSDDDSFSGGGGDFGGGGSSGSW